MLSILANKHSKKPLSIPAIASRDWFSIIWLQNYVITLLFFWLALDACENEHAEAPEA